MTKSDEEQLLRDVRFVKEEVTFLRESLVGDPKAKPEPTDGLVDVVKAHKSELYGDAKIQHIGLKPRVEALEKELRDLKIAYKTDRKLALMYASALSTGIGLAWYAAQLWFGK